MLLTASSYLAPVQYYVHLMRHSSTLIEGFDTYQKQTYRNRCLIAGAQGVQALTIPIVKPQAGHALMRDIRISDHGNWRHLHWNAMLSAYSSSPFYEYYADDLAPFYHRRWEFLYDFNMDLQHTICRLLDIDIPMAATDHFITPHEVMQADADIVDVRTLIQPRTPITDDANFLPQPYYQVFSNRHGFLPNLSIVDLLFNMGPEGILVLGR